MPIWDPAAIYPLTGEPMGTTWWRRWRTADGWHASTPPEIVEEYGWLFEPYQKEASRA